MSFELMKKFQITRKHLKGLTLLEMVIAMGIMAIVFAALLPQFANINNGWALRQASAETLQNGRVLADHLRSNLSKAAKITAVSDSSETNGFIEFENTGGTIFRYEIAENNYVQFGEVVDLSDLAGPVSKLQFTCYALDDLDTPITDVDSIRFVKVDTTLSNSGSLGRDQDFIVKTLLLINSADDTALSKL